MIPVTPPRCIALYVVQLGYEQPALLFGFGFTNQVPQMGMGAGMWRANARARVLP
eukprot:CAMPEP_0174365390 /NCGR_PEP_ID=MMETSP0811_2-20130205/77085_1 /TAXON_ID=73025 ORGANISM="Eutreptiella gymnastica-like, Strain CCMP1594" /NCGR_SAMPLE_ID=MMETSP0811_2 /ASSEMBLY_ACC=CAM_ASM_000667 /LENGTH=54 /DNA_ID=CAMNT_0015506001 /DNA_START=74 /DNA_END=238 /DNA_ORIENTATION=+